MERRRSKRIAARISSDSNESTLTPNDATASKRAVIDHPVAAGVSMIFSDSSHLSSFILHQLDPSHLISFLPNPKTLLSENFQLNQDADMNADSSQSLQPPQHEEVVPEAEAKALAVGLASLPDELLMHVSGFYQHHLELRTVSRRFDAVIKEQHCKSLCNQDCSVKCIVSNLVNRTSRMVWLGNLILKAPFERRDPISGYQNFEEHEEDEEDDLSPLANLFELHPEFSLSGFKSLRLTGEILYGTREKFFQIFAESLIALFSTFELEAPSSLKKLEIDPTIGISESDWSAFVASDSVHALANLTHFSFDIFSGWSAEMIQMFSKASPPLLSKLEYFSFSPAIFDKYDPLDNRTALAIVRTIASAPAFGTLRSLTLGGMEMDIACIQALSSASSVFMPTLQTLDVDFGSLWPWQPQVIQELISSPLAACLKSLVINDGSGGENDQEYRNLVQSIQHAKNLSNLHSLQMGGGWEGLQIGDYGLNYDEPLNRSSDYFESLSSSAHLNSLTNLKIDSADFFGLSKLFSSPHLKNLRTLSVLHCKVTAAEVESACNISNFSLTKLSELELSWNADQDQTEGASSSDAISAMSKLLKLSCLKSLKILNPDPPLTNSDIDLLCSSLWARNLAELSLSKCKIPLEVPFVANPIHFPVMKRLILDGNAISLECARLLRNISKCCPLLHSLSLSSCSLTKLHIERMTTNADLHSLEKLDLHDNPEIGFSSFNLIANCPTLHQLVELNLGSTTNQKQEQCGHLFETSCLTNLQSIRLSNNYIPANVLQNIIKHSPIMNKMRKFAFSILQSPVEFQTKVWPAMRSKENEVHFDTGY